MSESKQPKTFADLAREYKILSPLMEERTKLEMGAIYDKPLTLIDYDIVRKSTGEFYSVLVTEEHPDCFIFGGSVISDMLAKITASAGGLDEARALLAESPMAFKIVEKRSKTKDSGNIYRKYNDIEIL